MCPEYSVKSAFLLSSNGHGVKLEGLVQFVKVESLSSRERRRSFGGEDDITSDSSQVVDVTDLLAGNDRDRKGVAVIDLDFERGIREKRVFGNNARASRRSLVLKGADKLEIVIQALGREKLGFTPGITVSSKLDRHKRLRARRDNNVITGEGAGGWFGGDGLKGTRLDPEINADAMIEEQELVGSRDQDGIGGLEEVHAQNNRVRKIMNDDTGGLEGKAGAEMELDDGDALGGHDFLGGRHNLRLATVVEELGTA